MCGIGRIEPDANEKQDASIGIDEPMKEVIHVAAQKPASQVSPFAAMTLGDQNTRWLALHSQLLPYMTAVPAKDPPASGKPDGNANWRAGTPPMGQIPIFNSPPQPQRHDQYDAVHKRMDDAYKQTLVWQEIRTEG